MGLGIALMSYDGKICWGFNANPDIIPDLAAFVTFIEQATLRVAESAKVNLVGKEKKSEPKEGPPAQRSQKSKSKANGHQADDVVLPGGDRTEPTSA
jgi:hypothetical protein